MKRLKKKLINNTGLFFIVLSLFFLDLPFYVRSKQKRLGFVCILLAAASIICSVMAVFNFIAADTLSDNTDPESPVTIVKPAGRQANKPDPLTLLKPDDGKVNYPKGMLEKYKALYAVNDDTVGWLKIKDTSIDTVVTQGSNNSYYLHNDFYGDYTRYGNAFMDYRDNPKDLSQNTIIYGHTTVTGLQVFFDLNKYKDPNFFITHPVIEFNTLYADCKWKVFSVFISSTRNKDDNGYFFNYIGTTMNASAFPGYLNQVKQRELYSTGVDVGSSDKILTLSTCTYDNDLPGRTVDSRLVVAARLMRSGEGEGIDAAKVKANPGFRRPQTWYDYYGLSNPYAGSERWYP